MKSLFDDAVKCIRMFPHYSEDKIQDIFTKHSYEYTTMCLNDLLYYIDYLDKTDSRLSDEYFMKKYNLDLIDDSMLNNFKEG